MGNRRRKKHLYYKAQKPPEEPFEVNTKMSAVVT
jgi:hypothetical protein